MSLVSVIIPTYNSASTVARAVVSAFNQTYRDIEVIVVDDGSTDDTQRALSPHMRHINYLYQKNGGRSAARNHGIQESRGSSIAFLDSDDWWLPAKIERQVHWLGVDDQVGLVYNAHRVVDADGRSHLPGGKTGDIAAYDAFSDVALLRRPIGTPSGVMVRRSVIDQVGVFDETLHGSEDWDLWLRIAARYKVAYISQPLTMYQQHTGNQIERFAARRIQTDWYRVIEKVFSEPTVADRHGHLRDAALARVALWDALIDCSRQEFQTSEDKLARVHRLDNSVFEWPADEFVNLVIYFANNVGPGQENLDAALQFIDQVWSLLPDGVDICSSKNKRCAQGNLCAGRLFETHRQNQWDGIGSYAWNAARAQPRWLLNLGFLSVWMRSLLPALRPSTTSQESQL